MSNSHELDFKTRPNGDVHIFRNGKLVKPLLGEAAAAFLKAAKEGDVQALLAEAVGGPGGVRPSAGTQGPGSHLHGNGQSHAPQQFRRKTG